MRAEQTVADALDAESAAMRDQLFVLEERLALDLRESREYCIRNLLQFASH